MDGSWTQSSKYFLSGFDSSMESECINTFKSNVQDKHCFGRECKSSSNAVCTCSSHFFLTIFGQRLKQGRNVSKTSLGSSTYFIISLNIFWKSLVFYNFTQYKFLNRFQWYHWVGLLVSEVSKNHWFYDFFCIPCFLNPLESLLFTQVKTQFSSLDFAKWRIKLQNLLLM